MTNGTHEVVGHIGLMQEQRYGVNEDDRRDLGRESGVFEHVCADDGAVSGSISMVIRYTGSGKIIRMRNQYKGIETMLGEDFLNLLAHLLLW